MEKVIELDGKRSLNFEDILKFALLQILSDTATSAKLSVNGYELGSLSRLGGAWTWGALGAGRAPRPHFPMESRGFLGGGHTAAGARESVLWGPEEPIKSSRTPTKKMANCFFPNWLSQTTKAPSGLEAYGSRYCFLLTQRADQVVVGDHHLRVKPH